MTAEDDALARLHAAAPALLASVKELKTAYLCCIRVIAALGGNDLLVQEFTRDGVQGAVTVRAVEAILAAEG